MWEIDPSTHDPTDPGHPLRSTAHVFAFTFRGPYIDELRAMGFENVEQLPLAADPRLRKPVQLSPESAERYAAPVSFVGMSMVESVPAWEEAFLRLFCVHRGTEAREQGCRLLADALAKQRLDLSRNLFPELFADTCRGWPERDRQRLIRYASEIASAERRIITVSRLGRFGIQVWGDEGWRATAGAKVTYRGPAGHYADLNAIYCGSRINLDIGRLHQLDIVTMRNFDILACGGFVLAERSADLEKLFAIDKEIVCYSTQAELEQKVAHYLAHPDEARAIATAGRRAVLERHTISQRVGHMLERAGISSYP
jgi:spore maturation protein CgeB